MKVKLMYGPGSGRVVEVPEKADEWLEPVIQSPRFEDAAEITGGKLQPIQTVAYGPRFKEWRTRIWYPRDIRNYYVGSQWDGFRPDGAPSPSDPPQ